MYNMRLTAARPPKVIRLPRNGKHSIRTACSRRDDAGNLIPIKCNGNQIDEAIGTRAATGATNYTKEFREAVAAEANDPNRSIAEVARTHGLNANMVAQWRRRSREAQRATPAPCVALLPVDVTDLPGEDATGHSPSQDQEVSTGAATPSNCELEIEPGKRRARIRGISQGLAEQFLRDCLK